VIMMDALTPVPIELSRALSDPEPWRGAAGV
jgi:hypothetical protein